MSQLKALPRYSEEELGGADGADVRAHVASSSCHRVDVHTSFFGFFFFFRLFCFVWGDQFWMCSARHRPQMYHVIKRIWGVSPPPRLILLLFCGFISELGFPVSSLLRGGSSGARLARPVRRAFKQSVRAAAVDVPAVPAD